MSTKKHHDAQFFFLLVNLNLLYRELRAEIDETWKRKANFIPLTQRCPRKICYSPTINYDGLLLT